MEILFLLFNYFLIQAYLYKQCFLFMVLNIPKPFLLPYFSKYNISLTNFMKSNQMETAIRKARDWINAYLTLSSLVCTAYRYIY